MPIRRITIGIVAGEHSGDVLGARLIHVLNKYVPYARFVGVAGPLMKAEGMEAWYNIDELSVMGIIEILRSIPRILRIRRDLIRRFIALHPDVFIGIDAPDFTITLEKRLKKQGIHTIHYVSPSIWAWRSYRIFKIGQATDNILVLLPFEKDLYDRYNIPCQFVGYTLADTMPLDPDKDVARRNLGIPKSSRCLAILPGSRQKEVSMLSVSFLQAAKQVSQYFPGIKIIIPLVNATCREQFERIKANVAPNLSVKILNNHACDAMTAADVTLLASGTASIECMLAKCPMVVAYRMTPITFAIARFMIKTPWVSLPNILAGRKLVEEFLQKECRSEILSKAIIELFENHNKRKEMVASFRYLHQQIKCNADEQIAQAILSIVNKYTV